MTDESQLLIQARSGAREFAAFYRHFERPVLGLSTRTSHTSSAAPRLWYASESAAAFEPSAHDWQVGNDNPSPA